MSWQPIETAPKDGQEVIGYSSRTKHIYIIGWHSDAEEFLDMSTFREVPLLSHWMPLPEPPSESTDY